MGAKPHWRYRKRHAQSDKRQANDRDRWSGALDVFTQFNIGCLVGKL
jgi:hypothetical protein